MFLFELIALDKVGIFIIYFLISPWKHMLWVVGTYLKCLSKVLPMATNNMFICGEIRNTSTHFGWE